MWLFYCHTRYFGSVHCFCGLKILILNGSGLQIQTSGTAPNICWVGWVGTNIRGVGRTTRRIPNICHDGKHKLFCEAIARSGFSVLSISYKLEIWDPPRWISLKIFQNKFLIISKRCRTYFNFFLK